MVNCRAAFKLGLMFAGIGIRSVSAILLLLLIPYGRREKNVSVRPGRTQLSSKRAGGGEQSGSSSAYFIEDMSECYADYFV
jgi:hypothetical protein